MNIDEMLTVMEDTLDDSINLPLTGGKRAVDVEKITDLIDEIRRCMPDEIRQAKAIVQDRADIVSSAKQEAEAIVRRAEERARGLVSDAEIVKASQARAAEIVGTAQQQAKDIRTQVTDYCESMLKQTEDIMTKGAVDVKNVRLNLRARAKGSTNQE